MSGLVRRCSITGLVILAGCGMGTDHAIVTDRSPAEHPAFTWTKTRGEGYVLYFERGLAPQLYLFRRLIPNARENALRLMGALDTAPPIEVFLVGSRERMHELTGREANGMALPQHHAVVIVFRTGPNVLALRHETMHVLNNALWPGDGNAAWIREGLGVLGGGQCSGFTPRQIGAYLRSVGELPSLEVLQRRFGDLDKLRGHLASASFMQFVHETHGPSGLEAVWVGGLPGLARELGRPEVELATAWYDYLETLPQDEQLAEWSVIQGGCWWEPHAQRDGE